MKLALYLSLVTSGKCGNVKCGHALVVPCFPIKIEKSSSFEFRGGGVSKYHRLANLRAAASEAKRCKQLCA